MSVELAYCVCVHYSFARSLLSCFVLSNLVQVLGGELVLYCDGLTIWSGPGGGGGGAIATTAPPF